MRKLIFSSMLLALGSVLLVSCEKNDTSLDGAGNTLLKLNGGGPDPIILALSTDPLVEDVAIADIRRDAANSGDLNQAATVTFTNSQAYLDAYNDEHGTAYELLPTDAYTITTSSGVTRSGDTWTVTLAPGEFARDIKITLDKSLMDLSKSYAFGFELASTSVGKVATDNGEALVNVLIKNKYDGIYNLTLTTSGWGAYSITDAAALEYPAEFGLFTTGENTVNLFNYGRQDYLQPGFSEPGAGATAFGAASPEFTFDLATDKVILVDNTSPDDGRGRDFQLVADPASNYYDPASGNIYVKYFMKQNGRPNFNIDAVFTFVEER